MITHVATATVPTPWGDFICHAYRRPDGIEHLALVLADLDDDPLVRVHSECLTGDVFASARCDCGEQRDLALQLIAAEGRGALIYLRGQEGRGMSGWGFDSPQLTARKTADSRTSVVRLERKVPSTRGNAWDERNDRSPVQHT
jgi:GTP cyclohydrolase II